MRSRALLLPLILAWSCAGSSESLRLDGSGGPGPDHSVREAFAVLDASEGEQLAAIERAVEKLGRSITVQYRDAVKSRSLPELRRMRADAQAAADASRWREAGNVLQGAVVATDQLPT